MNDVEHRTRVDEVPEGFQMICSCGYVGKPRPNKFDAGEDEIAHHHTGGGPRNIEDVQGEFVDLPQNGGE